MPKGKNTVLLQFKESIPVKLENALADFGFTRYSRKIGEWVIYEKVLTPTSLNEFGMTKKVEDEIRHRLEKIIDAYLDPYSYTEAIREQCTRVANQLPKNQRAWVFKWIRDTIDCPPPWEDENYQPSLGFC